jgi:hypothetical protein
VSTADAGASGIGKVILAWNGEDPLPLTFGRCFPNLEGWACAFEVSVVVDGVRFQAADMAAQCRDRYTRILRLPRRLGGLVAIDSVCACRGAKTWATPIDTDLFRRMRCTTLWIT